VGWAILELIKQQGEETEHEVDDGLASSREGYLEVLDMLRYTHQEAIWDLEYMDKYYEPIDILGNLGGLTLVSPEFFPLATKIMTAVGAAVTDRSITLNGNECMQVGREVVAGHTDLKEEFLDLCGGCCLSDEDKEKMYHKLVEKVCNARFGAILRRYKDATIGRQGCWKTTQIY